MQAKEITRLNQVYNKLLKDAGCERVGKSLLTSGATILLLPAAHMHGTRGLYA